jgi:hypothetical protein
VTSTSFTLKANTTYLVFAFTNSTTGDSMTSITFSGGSPTFNLIGAGSLPLSDGKEYEFGRWLNGGGSNATGTITVTFVKTISQAYLQVVELCGNDTSAPITSNNAYATGNNTNPYMANLPAPPLAGTNFDVYFLCAKESLGPTAPVGTPAATNLFYVQGGGGTAGTYFRDTPPSQNESFAGASHHWGTIAVEIKRP